MARGCGRRRRTSSLLPGPCRTCRGGAQVPRGYELAVPQIAPMIVRPGMTADPPGLPAGVPSPVAPEARWRLYARFAIEAGSEAEALTVLREAQGRLKPDLPQHGRPAVHLRDRRHPDAVWIAQV